MKIPRKKVKINLSEEAKKKFKNNKAVERRIAGRDSSVHFRRAAQAIRRGRSVIVLYFQKILTNRKIAIMQPT